MLSQYSKVIVDSIESEKNGIDYLYSDHDKKVLTCLCNDINSHLGTSIQYLAEIDLLELVGCGDIVSQYIEKFSSESVKAYLIPKMVSDKIKNCDTIILKMYEIFKASDEYISRPNSPAPAHIYTRYDNAFYAMKSKRIKDSLLNIVQYPRDAFYLPLTVKLLSSWKIPYMEELLHSFLIDNTFTACQLGFDSESNNQYPTFGYIKRQLKFTALTDLRYFPTPENMSIIQSYTNDTDPDVRQCATKTFKSLLKSMKSL